MLSHEFNDVFSSVLPIQVARVPPFVVELKEGGIVKNQRARRLSGQNVANFVDKEINKLIGCNVLTKSLSACGSPLVIVTKKGDDPNVVSFRMCADYKNLNENTVPKGCSIPIIRDAITKLRGNKFYAKLDLTMGFHQCEVEEKCRHLLAVNTVNGKYEFVRVPFGPTNAPGYFQDIMVNHVLLNEHNDICIVYFDDIVVFGATWDMFIDNPRQVYTSLQNVGMVLKPKKCFIGYDTIEFCGFDINKKSFKPVAQKLDNIRNFVKPTTVKQLRRFLGLGNQLRDFCRNYHLIERRLTALYKTAVSKSKTKYCKGSALLKWTEDANAAYKLMLESISNSVELHHIDYDHPIYLEVDACNLGTGGILFQIINGIKIPIMFIGLSFNVTQQKWPTLEQEAFAVYHAITTCHHLLVGHHFYVYTDHKNLTYILKSETPKCIRWRLRLQEYFFSIFHIEGVLNIVADTISRMLVANAVQHNYINKNDLNFYNSTKYIKDSSDHHVMCAAKASKNLKFKFNSQHNANIMSEANLLDKEQIADIIKSSHNLVVGHRGVSTTIRELIEAGYNWPTLRYDVATYIQSCATCQKVWMNSTNVISNDGIQECYEPFQIVSVDVQEISHEPDIYGYRYLVNFICNFSKYLESIPVKEIDAEHLAEAYVKVFTRFAIAEVIKSDNAKIFTSELITEFVKMIGTRTTFSISHKHESNAIIERGNREVVRHIRCFTSELKKNNEWSRFVPMMCRIVNSTINKITGFRPSQIIYGNFITLDRGLFKEQSKPRLSTINNYVQDLMNNQSKFIKISQIFIAKDADKKANKIMKPSTKFNIGDYVLIRYPDNKPPLKLNSKWKGPLQVVDCDRSKYYLKDLITGTIIDRHQSFLKHYINDKDSTPFEVAMRDSQEFIIESITSHRLIQDYVSATHKKSYEFKVHWLGYEESKDTWLPWSELNKTEAMDIYLLTNQALKKSIRA